MKNNLVKLLCLVLSLIMVVTSFSACKKKNDDAVTSSDSADVENDNPDEIIDEEPDEGDDDDLDDGDDLDDWEEWDDPEDYEDEPDEDEPADEEEPDEEEPDVEEPEDEEPDKETDSDLATASLNIYNKTPVQNQFVGFAATYHMYAYRYDKLGRQYDQKMIDFEMDRVARSGITMARSMYNISDAWDSKNKVFDWESDTMTAFYKACLDLKERNVAVNVNHWSCSDYLFTTYPWGSEGNVIVDRPNGTQNPCHESVRVLDENGNPDQLATLKKFGEFMVETVKQLDAHGCTNTRRISIATEPYSAWVEDYADVISQDAYYERAAKGQAEAHNVVNQAFKDAGLRNRVDLQGPNFAGDGERVALYMKYFNKYVDKDAIDFVAAHNYMGNDVTVDNYDLWKECAELYGTQIDFKNFIWDEFNTRGSNSLENRRTGYNAVQLALAQTCFMNKGMKGSILWQLLDQQFPNNSATNNDSFKDGVHQCGAAPTLLWSSIVYPSFYGIQLLANAVRVDTLNGETAKVYRGDDDTYEGVYAFMTESNKNGDISIVTTNTNIFDTQITLNFEKSLGGKKLYRHVFRAENDKLTALATQIPPDKIKTNAKEVIKDVIPPYSIVVYTTKKLCD